METTIRGLISSIRNKTTYTTPDSFVNFSITKQEQAYSSGHRNIDLTTDWMHTSDSALCPSAYVFFVNSPSSSIFESALQRLQAMHDVEFNSSIAKSAAAVSATLAEVYELDEQGQNRTAARELMAFIEIQLRKNALSETNRLLAEANVACMSSRSMIGLIRSTYRLKDNLPAWDKAYRDSWKEISKQGKTPESLFVGLPNAMEDAVAAAS